MFKQKRPSGRVRTGRSDERHGGGGSGHGRGPGHHHHARPRGLSDANPSQPGSSMSSSADAGRVSSPGQTNGSTYSIVIVVDWLSLLTIRTATSHSQAIPPSPHAKLTSRRTSSKDSFRKMSDPETSIPSSFDGSPGQRQDVFSVESKVEQVQQIITESSASDDDDDEYDLELLGLDSIFPSIDTTWSSTSLGRASYNARSSYMQSTPNPADLEDYYFGTQPDLSPLTSSFPAPEKPPSFHLPYPSAYRQSRSASVSDAPSITDIPSLAHASDSSHSSGNLSTSSANSSVPVTPLSPALAEIVDAVAKVAVASPEKRLPRQPSLQSINEDVGYEVPRQSVDSECEKQSLSNFPLPPQNAKHQLAWIKTSLSNISEVDSARNQEWRCSNTAPPSAHSPDGSLSSLDMSTSPRSLSGKSSFDRSTIGTERRSSMTPVPQSGGGLARILNSKRSNSKLEKDAAKARIKADKLEQKLREHEEKQFYKQDKPDRDSLQYLAGLWSPKGSKLFKSDHKKRKQELEKQKVQRVTEQAKLRAESRVLGSRVEKSAESWAVSGIGGL